MKWDKYYHLPEIEEIRKKITETYTNKLTFVEDTHQYFLDGEEYMCVSNVTHKYKPISSEQMAENCVKKWQKEQNPSYKYYGMTKEEILAQWAIKSGQACEFGTDVHAFGEGMFYYMTEQYDKIPAECIHKFEGGKPHPTNMHEEAIVKFWDDLPENMVPVLAETKVFNRNGTKFSGTFDILFYYVDTPNSPKNGLVIFDYKGLDINTPILTTEGWKTMGTVNIGDTVFDCDGKETKILHTSEVHHNPCYKIYFDNGEAIVADHEHRWVINFWRRPEKKISKVMTTEEIFDFMNTHSKRKDVINIPRIICNKCIGSNKELPIDPYVLGVWLGDGNSADGKVTNMYEEIYDEIHKRGFEIGNDVSQGGTGKAKTRTIFGLSTLLRKEGLLKNKHIPPIYLTSSYEQKMDLLRGLMDTDGYYNPVRKRYILSTTRIYQKDFCVELLSSMGIKCTCISCKKYCTNGKNKNPYNGFDVCFTCDDYPFLIRKLNVVQPKTNKHSFFNIKKIEKVDTIPTRCIEVDSPTHTFLFGKHMIITHNTNESLISDYSRNRGTKLLWPFNDFIDENQSYYTLQLSLYQIPMQNLGYKVLGRRLIHLLPDGTYNKVKLPDITDRLRDALDIPSVEEIISKNIL